MPLATAAVWWAWAPCRSLWLLPSSYAMYGTSGTVTITSATLQSPNSCTTASLSSNVTDRSVSKSVSQSTGRTGATELRDGDAEDAGPALLPPPMPVDAAGIADDDGAVTPTTLPLWNTGVASKLGVPLDDDDDDDDDDDAVNADDDAPTP